MLGGHERPALQLWSVFVRCARETLFRDGPHKNRSHMHESICAAAGAARPGTGRFSKAELVDRGLAGIGDRKAIFRSGRNLRRLLGLKSAGRLVEIGTGRGFGYRFAGDIDDRRPQPSPSVRRRCWFSRSRCDRLSDSERRSAGGPGSPKTLSVALSRFVLVFAVARRVADRFLCAVRGVSAKSGAGSGFRRNWCHREGTRCGPINTISRPPISRSATNVAALRGRSKRSCFASEAAGRRRPPARDLVSRQAPLFPRLTRTNAPERKGGCFGRLGSFDPSRAEAISGPRA